MNMKKTSIIISIVLSITLILSTFGSFTAFARKDTPQPKTPEHETVVEIPDKNLKRALNKRLSYLRPENAEITKEDLGTMSGSLILDSEGIENIEGLQYCTYVNTISLYSNKISDISQLSKLKKLKKLNISKNLISDCSPLNNLINMESLYIFNNQISDISFIKNMPKIKYLNMQNNYVFDLTPIASASNLETLYLGTQQYEAGTVKANVGDKIYMPNVFVNTDGTPLPPLPDGLISYDENYNELIFDCVRGNTIFNAAFYKNIKFNGKTTTLYGIYNLLVEYN